MKAQPQRITADAEEYRHAPYDIDVEQALLGAIFVDNSAFERAGEVLVSADLWDPLHQRMWDAMRAMRARSLAIAPLTLLAEMKDDGGLAEVEGHRYLSGLAAAAPAMPNVRDYARILLDRAVRREVVQAANDMVARARDLTTYSNLLEDCEASFRDIRDKLADRLCGGVSTIALATLLRENVEPVRDLVPGLIERGIPNFLCAPGGAHKSRLGLQFGICISAGHPVFGGFVERATFFHVSCEDKVETEVARRAQAIVARLGIRHDIAAEFLDRVGQDSALALMREGGGYTLLPFWWELRRKLLAIDGHKFVLLDSCYDMVRFEGKGKIDEAAVNAFVKTVLQRLCDETDSTLLVLWHPSQSGLDRGDAGGWSVAWHNSPRLRLSISPVKDAEEAFELKVEKRSHGPKGKPLTLYWADGALLPRGDMHVSAHKARLEQACVTVAIEAAERGIPIQGKGKIARAHVDAIERRIGARPSERDIKEMLTAAVLVGGLAHVKATRHRAAGYYPPDLNAAAELACAAKRRSTNGVDADA